MAHPHSNLSASSPVGPVLVTGFAGALAVWCAWFAAPLPWVALPENLAIGLAAVLWLGVSAACLRRGGKRPSILVGVGAGLVTAAICLIPLASTLRPAGPNEAPLSHPLPTDAWKVVAAFFAAGGVIGAIAALLARALPARQPAGTGGNQAWLCRFAIVAALSVAPLLFFGGLVTSNNAGMAVPDWPTTFGAQMFFYPMGSETNPDVYLEHTHRLFGTLVGLTTLVLMVWTLVAGRTRWEKGVAIVSFVLVGGQGVLGGARVWLQTHLAGNDPASAERVGRLLAFVHGILAQLVFGCIVALAIYLSPGYARTGPMPEVETDRARRLKRFATGLLHALIVQLIFGAMARHFRKGDHALWTHAAFSIIIVGFAAMAGFAAASLPRTASAKGVAALRRSGGLLVAVVVLQFTLGWGAFSMRGPNIKADSTMEAIIRTAHQANGALLLAAATLTFVWARWLLRAKRAGEA